MNLTSGTRLGVYEIIAPIGAGGMGEVYRARDTRLDRTVALKVLPPRFAAGEMRERFEREARVVSNLNHPNICTLYDVGRQDDVAFLVMEYIEGQTLADRLARGPLPLDQALRHAIDIAEALTKAHAHGIVHRDLKPGNVMITRTGAKLLDFGLARRADEALAVSQDAPTVHGAPLTAEGTILGTLHYMSPEQLEGGAIDARSDLFAFGAVLYEMVTGRRAFEATSHASLITRIMSEQPRPVRELQPVTPRAIERIIERCLQKEPEHRWQCAGDLVAELREISGETEAEKAALVQRRPIVPWAIAALFAIAAIALGWMLMRKPRGTSAPVRFTIAPPAPGTQFSTTVLWTPMAVSPDGTTIAFTASQAGGRYLWTRRIDEAQAKRHDGTSDAIAPFWSPDSKSVAFFAGPSLSAVNIESGTVHKICDIPPGMAGTGAWGSGGQILFSDITGDLGLHIVPANGGTSRKVPDTNQTQHGAHDPRFLADGRRFLYIGIDKTSAGLWFGSLDGGKPKRIIDVISHVDYVPPYMVYARDGAIVAQRFDEDTLQLTGDAVAIAPSVYNYKLIGFASFSAAARTIAWLPFPPPARIVYVDRNGVERGEALKAGDYHQVVLSPDGRRLLATVAEPATGIASLWVGDLTRRTMTRASFGDVDYDNPQWAFDGKRVAFTMDADGPAHLFMKTLGDPKDERLRPPGNIQSPSHWIEDRLFFNENTGARRADIMTMSFPDRRVSEWLATRFNESHARVSPDRKWVAFLSDQSGRTELYVAPIDRSGDAVQLSNGGTSRSAPRWKRDGSELYYVNGRDVYAVPIRAGAVFDAGEPVRLFTAATDLRAFEAAPDGDRFILTLSDERGRWLSVAVNWQEQVEKQLAPAK